MDISSFPCTQLVFAFSLGWTLKEVNINGDFNQYIWAFSLGWTQETDVRVTSSSLLISSGKPEEVFPTNIFSVLNECPPLSTEPKLFNTIPTQFLLSHFYPHWFSTEPVFSLFQRTLFLFINWNCRQLGRSHTESTDTIYKTLQSFWLTKRSCQRCWTQVICWAVPRYVLVLLKDGHQWNGVSPLNGTLQERKR